MTAKLKTGAVVLVEGFDYFGSITYEAATIARHTSSCTKIKGYYRLRFASGGYLMVHESRIKASGQA